MAQETNLVRNVPLSHRIAEIKMFSFYKVKKVSDHLKILFVILPGGLEPRI